MPATAAASKTIAEMDDEELAAAHLKWLLRTAFATKPFSQELAANMAAMIERERDRRAEGPDPMRGVQFPFAANH